MYMESFENNGFYVFPPIFIFHLVFSGNTILSYIVYSFTNLVYSAMHFNSLHYTVICLIVMLL